jgi:hypothetical protein
MELLVPRRAVGRRSDLGGTQVVKFARTDHAHAKGMEPPSNYAFKPIAEQARRSDHTIVPQRLNAALEII